jgi:hypothetical protein
MDLDVRPHPHALVSLAEWAVTPRGRETTIRRMRMCPVCGTEFDDRDYQLVIGDLGPFDSIDCAEEAVRKAGREARGELVSDLLEAARLDEVPADGAGDGDGELRVLRGEPPNRPAA